VIDFCPEDEVRNCCERTAQFGVRGSQMWQVMEKSALYICVPCFITNFRTNVLQKLHLRVFQKPLSFAEFACTLILLFNYYLGNFG